MSVTKELIASLEEKRRSTIISLIYSESAGMDRGDVERVSEEISRVKKAAKTIKKLDMLLDSTGGEAAAAYKMALVIRDLCDEFNIIVLDKAKSGATLLVLAADKILMGPTSELGPIDPVVSHPLRSGLMVPARSISYFIENVLPQLSRSVPSAAGSFLPIDYVHVGFCALARKEGEDYARRLLDAYHSKEEKKKRDGLVAKLSEGYSSHHFPILFKEANSIGLKVERIPEDEWNILQKLMDAYRDELNDIVLIVETREHKQTAEKPKIRWL